jgi:hypothetical protein
MRCFRVVRIDDFALKYEPPHRLVCYIHRHSDPPGFESLREEGFRLKKGRPKDWSDEEKEMLISGIDSMESGATQLDSMPVGYFLSHHVMDRVRSEADCRRALKGILLEDERYDILRWCAKQRSGASDIDS